MTRQNLKALNYFRNILQMKNFRHTGKISEFLSQEEAYSKVQTITCKGILNEENTIEFYCTLEEKSDSVLYGNYKKIRLNFYSGQREFLFRKRKKSGVKKRKNLHRLMKVTGSFRQLGLI